MKKVILLFALLPILIVSCEQTKEAKAEKIIKKYLKQTMDDYGSYTPMSYSELIITMTKWKLPIELKPELTELIEIAKRINQQFGYKIELTQNADYYIERINANHIIDEINKYTEEKYKKHTTEEFRNKLYEEKKYGSNSNIIKTSYMLLKKTSNRSS